MLKILKSIVKYAKFKEGMGNQCNAYDAMYIRDTKQKIFNKEIVLWYNANNQITLYYDSSKKQMTITFSYDAVYQNPGRDDNSCNRYPRHLLTLIQRYFPGKSGTIGGTAFVFDENLCPCVEEISDFAYMDIERIIKERCIKLCGW